jgi:hypothetical protein
VVAALWVVVILEGKPSEDHAGEKQNFHQMGRQVQVQRYS